MSKLLDSFEELVQTCLPDPQDYGAQSTIDQNLGLIIETAKDASLDLRDPATLATVRAATALATTWVLNHIDAFCDVPACADSADQHARAALGQLGAHFAQLEKLLAT